MIAEEAMTGCLLRRSQVRAVPLSEPERRVRVFSDLLMMAEETMTGCLLRWSQVRAVPSSEPESRRGA